MKMLDMLESAREVRVRGFGRRALAVPETQSRVPAHSAAATALLKTGPMDREDERTKRFKGYESPRKSATQKENQVVQIALCYET
jgi:hypothetical protein